MLRKLEGKSGLKILMSIDQIYWLGLSIVREMVHGQDVVLVNTNYKRRKMTSE